MVSPLRLSGESAIGAPFRYRVRRLAPPKRGNRHSGKPHMLRTMTVMTVMTVIPIPGRKDLRRAEAAKYGWAKHLFLRLRRRPDSAGRGRAPRPRGASQCGGPRSRGPVSQVGGHGAAP